MSEANDTIRVFVPLAFKRKNGRPRILAPDVEPHFQARVQDPHILRAHAAHAVAQVNLTPEALRLRVCVASSAARHRREQFIRRHKPR